MMVQAQQEHGEDEAVHEEPSMQLKELMDFCTKLQQRVLDLENTKTAQAQEITSLKKRVKKLEKKEGIQDPLKWDQQVVSDLVALRNFAKKIWIKTQYIWWLHQKCLCSNLNGNAPPITKLVEGVETIIAPSTAEEKAQRSTSSTNGAVNTAHGVTTASTQATAVNSTTIDNLSDVVIYAFFANGYANNKGKEILEEYWKKAYCEWAPWNQEYKNKENIRSVPVEITTSNALISYDGLGDYD
ncbi:hypothetical protein Tco_1395050 [Tanacetum coccineum]